MPTSTSRAGRSRHERHERHERRACGSADGKRRIPRARGMRLMSDGARILTINGGSSSVTIALYRMGDPPQRGLCGKIDRIGLSGVSFAFNDPVGKRHDELGGVNKPYPCSDGGDLDEAEKAVLSEHRVPVAELRRRVALRRTRPRDPEHRVEHPAMIGGRTPAPRPVLDQERCEDRPPLVRHQPARHSRPPQRAALNHASGDLGIPFVHGP